MLIEDPVHANDYNAALLKTLGMRSHNDGLETKVLLGHNATIVRLCVGVCGSVSPCMFVYVCLCVLAHG